MDIWYHGSPLQLSTLLAGSTITRNRHLAEVFSHKPEIVSIEDDGAIRHNGRLAGFLYIVDEVLSDDDIYPHPRTTMPAGWEWLTRRPLSLSLVGSVRRLANERLNESVIARLRMMANENNTNE